MENKRITWIDSAKGLGIFLVVLGHTTIPNNIFLYIFSFHMPLFFFLSGFLYRDDKFESWKDFFTSKFRKLVVPYILFFVVIFIYWILIGRTIGDAKNINVSAQTIFFEFLYKTAYLKTPFAPLWFLLSLFWVELIFHFLKKNIAKKYLLLLSLILISCVGYFYSIKFNVRPPWAIDIALIGVLFYGLGYLVKNFKNQIANISNYYLLIFVPILILIGWFISTKNIQIDMMANQYGLFYLFLVSAFSGIGAVIMLAKSWPNRVWQYLGRNSLFIFLLQFVALDLGKWLVHFFWPNLDLAKFGGTNILLGLGLSIFAISLLSGINEIYSTAMKYLNSDQK